MKIAVLFPGIGYTCEKPLLYYAGKLAAERGYEVLPVRYGGFPPGVKGHADRMRACEESARAQAVEILKDVCWSDYDEILFIGKSIGTAVGCWYAQSMGLAVRSALLTPLVGTFQWLSGEAVAFHGTADPWADTPSIRALCAEKGVPLYITEGANHSLETGRVAFDLETLAATVARLGALCDDGRKP